MPLNDTAKNLMLDFLGARLAYVSLHTADPSTDGRNEVTGGAPAYRRKAIAWGAAAGGVLSDSTNGIDLDVPAGTTIRYVGLWSAETAGTFYGSDAVTSESFGGQGIYRLTDYELTAVDA